VHHLELSKFILISLYSFKYQVLLAEGRACAHRRPAAGWFAISTETVKKQPHGRHIRDIQPVRCSHASHMYPSRTRGIDVANRSSMTPKPHTAHPKSKIRPSTTVPPQAPQMTMATVEFARSSHLDLKLPALQPPNGHHHRSEHLSWQGGAPDK